MKPRILVHMHYLEIGGAERALLGLLDALDPERVSVDLFLNQHTGELLPLMPPHVNLLPERRGYNAIERPLRDIVREGQWRVALARLRARWQHRRYHKTLSDEQRRMDSSAFQSVSDCVTPILPPMAHTPQEYDLAISFLTPHNIVLDKVRARKKVAWIHTDYSTVHVNAEQELPVWSRYDHIASISEDCTRSFLKTFPSLESKIVLIENTISPAMVRRQAEAFDASTEMGITADRKHDKCLIILSIGRFCHAKNYDNVPDIMRRIVEMGHTGVRWYLIGFGNERLIRDKIAEAGMQEHVIILGKKENPYPYIKACDIYVQPSRYEGKSVTVREAQILCKPVIITNYATAASQVHDGVDGVICGMDNASIARAIADMASDAARRQALSDYLAAHDYGNEAEVNKIYQLLGKQPPTDCTEYTETT